MSNNVALHFIKTTPPITRALVILTMIISAAVYLDIFAPQQISYSRYYLKDLELHRLFTSFFYYGRGNFELVMNFIFLYKYSSLLEESYGRTSDYLYVTLIIFICLAVSSTILYIPFLATPLSNTITYIWTRKNPQSIVQMFGFVSFSAFYLPFVYPVVTLIFEGSISKDEIIGILVGHIVFYFTEVYPKFGRRFLATPCLLHRIFNEECDKCKKKTPAPEEKEPSNVRERREPRTLIVPVSRKEQTNESVGIIGNESKTADNIDATEESEDVEDDQDTVKDIQATGNIENVTGSTVTKTKEVNVEHSNESDSNVDDFESEDLSSIEETEIVDENSWESS